MLSRQEPHLPPLKTFMLRLPNSFSVIKRGFRQLLISLTSIKTNRLQNELSPEDRSARSRLGEEWVASRDDRALFVVMHGFQVSINVIIHSRLGTPPLLWLKIPISRCFYSVRYQIIVFQGILQCL